MTLTCCWGKGWSDTGLCEGTQWDPESWLELTLCHSPQAWRSMSVNPEEHSGRTNHRWLLCRCHIYCWKTHQCPWHFQMSAECVSLWTRQLHFSLPSHLGICKRHKMSCPCKYSHVILKRESCSRSNNKKTTFRAMYPKQAYSINFFSPITTSQQRCV